MEILKNLPRIHLNKGTLITQPSRYPRISLDFNLPEEAKEQQGIRPPRIHLNGKDIFIAHGKIPRIHLNSTQQIAA